MDAVRGAPDKAGEFRLGEGLEHGAQAFRRFRMLEPSVALQARRMVEHGCRHDRSSVFRWNHHERLGRHHGLARRHGEGGNDAEQENRRQEQMDGHQVREYQHRQAARD